MEASNPLVGKNILSPIQKSFISLFSRLADNNQFYLTGGTALAEYYLGHRLSFDLDFFTGVDGLVMPVSYQIEKMGKDYDLDISVIRRFNSYSEFLITKGADSLKIDLALDSPFRFKPPILSVDGIMVNDFQDLCVDKLLAYFGRAEPRDAVDLYFILQHGNAEELLQQASQKDTGFSLYWFAIALNRCAKFPDELESWPVKMLVPFDPPKVKRVLLNWAQEIMGGLTPSSG